MEDGERRLKELERGKRRRREAGMLTHDERMWLLIDKSTACWLWLGFIPKDGYVHTNRQYNGKRFGLLHRYMYERFVGLIPEGLEIEHTCHVRHCLNPDHLIPVTTKVNCETRGPRRAYRLTKEQRKRGYARLNKGESIG